MTHPTRNITDRRRQRAAQRAAEQDRLGQALQASIAEANAATGGTAWEVVTYPDRGRVGVSRTTPEGLYLYIEGSSSEGWWLDAMADQVCVRRGFNHRPYARLGAAIARADLMASNWAADRI